MSERGAIRTTGFRKPGVEMKKMAKMLLDGAVCNNKFLSNDIRPVKLGFLSPVELLEKADPVL